MLRFAISYYLNQKRRMMIYILGLILSIAASLVSPQLVGSFIDGLIARHDINFIIYFVVVFFLIQILMMSANFLLTVIGGLMQTKASIEINLDILLHLQKLPFIFFNGRDLIYLNQRVNTDSSVISSYILNNFTSLMRNLITFSFSAVYIFLLKSELLIIILCIICLYLLFYSILKKKIYEKGYEFKESQSEYFSILNAQLTQILSIKLYNLYGYFHEKLRMASNVLIGKFLAKQKLNFLSSNLDRVISILAQCFFFFILGLSVINDEITIGQFTIINTYFGYLIGTMSSVTSFKQSYIDTLISYKRVKEFCDLKAEVEGDYAFRQEQIKCITMDNFTFKYGNKAVIRSFSCSFNFGEITCITGNNGSGKTTLLLSLLGLFKDNYTGSVLFNNINISDINMRITRRFIGFAPQEPIIIPYANIIQNIFIGNKTKIDNAKSLIYPNLYSVVDLKESKGDLKNQSLSGGEKQKVSILRIIENDFSVIILDEPTNDLDKDSKNELMTYLEKCRHEKLIIIVTHDRDLLKLSDKIINLDIAAFY